MNLFQALKKGRTVSELVKATGMTRGGVVQALRRNRKLVKKTGTKREHTRGPESTIYQLKAGAKVPTQRKARAVRAKKPLTLEDFKTAANLLLQEAVAEVKAEAPVADVSQPIEATEAPALVDPTNEELPF